MKNIKCLILFFAVRSSFTVFAMENCNKTRDLGLKSLSIEFCSMLNDSEFEDPYYVEQGTALSCPCSSEIELWTSGLSTCTALAMTKGHTKILAHIDESKIPYDLLKILKRIKGKITEVILYKGDPKGLPEYECLSAKDKLFTTSHESCQITLKFLASIGIYDSSDKRLSILKANWKDKIYY